ncbi:MAG: trans-sulfuration enzyme family protein [Chitinophagaceae bacterium]|jgi:methionine-gamma-lyase
MSGNNKIFKGFSSLAIHAGQHPDPMYAHLTPIYASSTYVYDEAEQGSRRFSGQEKGYIYSRWGNPTMNEAEEKIAAMETFGLLDNGSPMQAKAILHASGMAAISSLLLATLKKGDKILTHYSLYSGTQDYMKSLLEPLELSSIIVDLRDLSLAEKYLKEDSAIKMIYLETPANPTLQCVDLQALSNLAKQYGKITACDNTFATPFLQQPFKYGIDYVVHSTTKFLNGHGTAIGGVLVGRDIEFMNTRVTKTHRLLGGNSNAFEAFLLINGMKTLELRMQRHCDNAMHVANFLSNHHAIEKVNYNGLSTHPDFAVSQKQMNHPGAMMSFELKGGFEAGVKFMNKLQMCTRTVSLGTCDTLLSHPASMSHSSIPKANRIEYGITDGLIRLSVGIENRDDILNDFDQALK